MKKIMFNDKYGLTRAVIDGRKTQTRRVINITETDKEYLDTAFDWDLRESVIVERYAKYKFGEEVAVAQKYSECHRAVCFVDTAGWNNKMFVNPYIMPHRIRITNIRVERLQDISEGDCLREGIDVDRDFADPLSYIYTFKNGGIFYSPRIAFETLIDKTCGKGTWQSNPWVFVYDFELIK